MFVRILIAFLVSLQISTSAPAADKVDLELVLLADASGSIDEAETQFQREGYATAITHRDVLKAIASGGHQKIAVTYVEWGDQHYIDVVVPWMIVNNLKTAKAFAGALRTRPKQAWGRNAIGAAIAKGQSLIEQNAIHGDRKVIDFSGDSANNWNGISIAEARAKALAAGIVINGLAIACRDIGCGQAAAYDLQKAFAKEIIGGPGSFVVTVDSRKSFGEAVRRKLILEIASVAPRRRRHASVD